MNRLAAQVMVAGATPPYGNMVLAEESVNTLLVLAIYSTECNVHQCNRCLRRPRERLPRTILILIDSGVGPGIHVAVTNGQWRSLPQVMQMNPMTQEQPGSTAPGLETARPLEVPT